MKMFKSLCSLMLIVLMLITSVSFTAFAEDAVAGGGASGGVSSGGGGGASSGAPTVTPEVVPAKYTDVSKWMYPYWDGTTVDVSKNPLITAKTLNSEGKTEADNYSVVWKNGISSEQTLIGRVAGVKPEGVSDDYRIIRQSVSTSWTKRTGIEYRPKLSDADFPYYELYVDLTDHANNVAADLQVEIITEFGKYVTDLEAIEAESGFEQETRFVGVVKLSDAPSDRISILLPTENITTGEFISVGGILLKQLNIDVTKDKSEPNGLIKYNDMITKWVYPTAHASKDGNIGSHKGVTDDTNDFNSVVFRNGSVNSYLDMKANSSGSSTETDLPEGYVLSRTGLGAPWTKKSGIVYETVLANKINPYYEVWVELFGHDNGYDVPLKMEIVGDDGTYTTLLPQEDDVPVVSGGTWRRKMHKVGIVKLSSPDFNTISLLAPCDRPYYDKNNLANKTTDGYAETNEQNITRPDYMAFGGVKLVQVEGVPNEDELLKLERSVNIIEPRADLYTHWNGFGTGGGKYEATSQNYTSFTLDDIYELNVTDGSVERSNASGYDTKHTQRKANIYKGMWADSEAQAGWYKLYIDKLAHKNSTPIPFFTIQVTHEGGISEYIMDRNHPSDDKKTDWNQSRHYIGTFKMRHGGIDQVRIYFPLLADGKKEDWRADLGAIIAIPVTEEEAVAAMNDDKLTKETGLYLKPAYSANFGTGYTVFDGSELEWYGGQYQLKMDGSNAETSVTAAYTANCGELVNALGYNEGAMIFDLYWQYKDGIVELAENTPYFSVVLGKSATSYAEIRIYKDKTVLIEDANTEDTVQATETPLYVPTDYIFEENKNSSRSLGIGWNSNLRIEIIDVSRDELKNGIEYTSRNKSEAGEGNAYKLLKVYLKSGSSNEICIGANYIPKGSLLYNVNDDVSDNYIKFVNNPGSVKETNLVKVKNFRVAVPDSTITSDDIVEEIKDLTVENGIASWSVNTYIPYKYTNILANGFKNVKYAKILASYSDDAMKNVAACDFALNTGDKKSVDLSVNVSSGDKVKFFEFDDMKNLKPLKNIPVTEVTVD